MNLPAKSFVTQHLNNRPLKRSFTNANTVRSGLKRSVISKYINASRQDAPLVLNIIVILVITIERFHSRDQQPNWSTETKDSFLHKNRVQIPED